MGRGTNWAKEQSDFMGRMHELDKQVMEQNRKEKNQQSEIEWRNDMIDSLAEENNRYKEQLAAKDAELMSFSERVAELEAQLQEKDKAVSETVEMIE